MYGDIEYAETEARVTAIRERLANIEHTGDGECQICAVSQLAELAGMYAAVGEMRWSELMLLGMETVVGMHPEFWEAFGGSVSGMAAGDPEAVMGAYLDQAREIRYALQLGTTDWDAMAAELATELGVDVAEVAPAVESVKEYYATASPDAVEASESGEGTETSPEPVASADDAVADSRERFLAKLRSMLNIT